MMGIYIVLFKENKHSLMILKNKNSQVLIEKINKLKVPESVTNQEEKIDTFKQRNF